MKHLIRCLIAGVFTLTVCYVTVSAQMPNLSQVMKPSNMGQEYYFTFPPIFEVQGGEIKLYISSPVECSVMIEVEGKGFITTRKTIPNDIIEVDIPPQIAQAIIKQQYDELQPERIYPKTAIHILAEFPVVVYGAVRYPYTSDTFLVLPTEATGTKYIVSSIGDMSAMYGGYSLPSETTITGIYDNTTVTFTLGGNSKTRTSGGMLPGQTKTFVIDRGDVVVIGNAKSSKDGDLSGSIIEADNPVAVVSGNQCANVPLNMRWCDYIAEMERPVQSWGNTYLIPRVNNRLRSALIRVYSAEPNNTISRNNIPWKTIATVGGTEGVGFISDRVDTLANTVAAISAESPITCTLYNPGQEDDNVPSDPFQMNILPFEQFSYDIIFCTPGIKTGKKFDKNFVNIIYPLDSNNLIPDELQFAIQQGDTTVNWQPLSAVFGKSVGDIFVGTFNGLRYASKQCELPRDNVYLINCNMPIGVYSYGFSNYDSYGMPAGSLDMDIQAKRLGDIQPPVPTVLTSKHNMIEGTVVEKNDGGVPSAISKVQLNYGATNYVLSTGKINSVKTTETTWQLKVKDVTKTATGTVIFTDRAGNDTTLAFSYMPTSDVKADAEIESLELYPNPVSKTTIISFQSEQPSTVKIISVMGVDMFTLTIPETGTIKRTIDMSTLAQGTYLVKITSGTHETVKKIVKE